MNCGHLLQPAGLCFLKPKTSIASCFILFDDCPRGAFTPRLLIAYLESSQEFARRPISWFSGNKLTRIFTSALSFSMVVFFFAGAKYRAYRRVYVVLFLSLFSRSACCLSQSVFFFFSEFLFLAAKIKGHSPGSESGEFHGPATRPNGAVTLFCCQPDAVPVALTWKTSLLPGRRPTMI